MQDSIAIGSNSMEIHLASKRKPSQNEGKSEASVMFAGLNKKTVASLKKVNMMA